MSDVLELEYEPLLLIKEYRVGMRCLSYQDVRATAYILWQIIPAGDESLSYRVLMSKAFKFIQETKVDEVNEVFAGRSKADCYETINYAMSDLISEGFVYEYYDRPEGFSSKKHSRRLVCLDFPTYIWPLFMDNFLQER